VVPAAMAICRQAVSGSGRLWPTLPHSGVSQRQTRIIRLNGGADSKLETGGTSSLTLPSAHLASIAFNRSRFTFSFGLKVAPFTQRSI